MPLEVAFPFIRIEIDTSGLRPVAQRAPGVLAVVGVTPAGAAGGAAVVNVPEVVATTDDAISLFAQRVSTTTPEGVTTVTLNHTALSRSLLLAMLQDPHPTKIYGVRAAAGGYAAALASLEALDDVTFVCLAEESGVTALGELKAHVEQAFSDGNKRLGVGMVNPTILRSNTYVTDVLAAIADLKSDVSRMVMVAARSADGDAATAAASAIAGYRPHISAVLKRVRGVRLSAGQGYTPREVAGLAEGMVNPVIDPTLIVGESLHLADGFCFTTDTELAHIDTVRTLDDIEFRLRAGLIGAVGDARITKAGLTRVKLLVDSILGPLVRDAVIDAYTVRIPVLDVLSIPEEARTPTDTSAVTDARANRRVDLLLSVTYGPAVHRLAVTLAMKF